jgi:hypothetical protein
MMKMLSRVFKSRVGVLAHRLRTRCGQSSVLHDCNLGERIIQTVGDYAHPT